MAHEPTYKNTFPVDSGNLGIQWEVFIEPAEWSSRDRGFPVYVDIRGFSAGKFTGFLSGWLTMKDAEDIAVALLTVVENYKREN